MVVLKDVRTWLRGGHIFIIFGPLLQLQGTFVAVGDEMSMKKLLFWIGSLDPTWVFRLDFQVPFDKRKIDVYACPMMLGAQYLQLETATGFPCTASVGPQASPPQSEASHGEAGNLRLRTELPGGSGYR